MNKGQFCLSMGKSDKSIWQLALIVSLKIVWTMSTFAAIFSDILPKDTV